MLQLNWQCAAPSGLCTLTTWGQYNTAIRINMEVLLEKKRIHGCEYFMSAYMCCSTVCIHRHFFFQTQSSISVVAKLNYSTDRQNVSDKLSARQSIKDVPLILFWITVPCNVNCNVLVNWSFFFFKRYTGISKGLMLNPIFSSESKVLQSHICEVMCNSVSSAWFRMGEAKLLIFCVWSFAIYLTKSFLG